MPFADELIGADTARSLTSAIAAAAPGTPLPALRSAARSLGSLTLSQRADLLATALLRDLPGDYASFVAVVRTAQHGGKPFTGWLIWPVTSAVATRAIEDGGTAAFDDALDLLAALTHRLTGEFAIRALLAADLDRAVARITTWTTSDDVDVRRLASEGTRSFLPWAKRVKALLADPRATLPIINALYRDDSEYVRRSVANHLNDLSRQQPDLVVETATAWLAAPDANTARLVRHGLRTLIKQGHPGALHLLGFAPATDVTVTGPALDVASVPFGGTLTFTATVTNTGADVVKLAIDYVVHHTRANGGQTAKTFTLTTRTLAPGERFDISRDHSFREITTRRYYPGAHAIELQVNGAVTGRSEFTLLTPGRP
jgi:3-methyladenine DNA glycosylase AlkC